MAKVYTTPGVYIEEKSAFPNSVVPVATAIPAFVGYTQKAIHNGKSLKRKPTRLSSFGEYLLYFGGGPKTTYSLKNDRKEGSNTIYQVEPLNDRYFLFNSLKLFFANGGSDCYIISVGSYNDPIKSDILADGITPLIKESEPTMLVIPDAVLLDKNDCYSLQQQMLAHCGMEMRNRVSIFDIHGGFEKRTPEGLDVVKNFQEGIGTNFLQWGAAYYPWVYSTVISASEVDFTNIDATSRELFMNMLIEEIESDVRAGITKPERANLITAETKSIPRAILHGGISKLFEGVGEFSREISKIQQEDIDAAKVAIREVVPVEGEELRETQKKAFAETLLGQKSKELFTPTLEALQALQAFDVAGDNTQIPALTVPLEQTETAKEFKAVAGKLEGLKNQLEQGEISDALILIDRHFSNVSSTANAIEKLQGANVSAPTPKEISGKIRETFSEKNINRTPEMLLEEIRSDIQALKKPFADDKTIKDVMALVPFNPFLSAAGNGVAISDIKLDELQINTDQVLKSLKNSQTLHQTLMAIHPLYKSILTSVHKHMNLLPPSAGIAGIYSMVDNSVGVWQSPANVSLGSVVKPAINITNEEQENLNLPLNGKAVNPIRTFPGKGTLVWGARTLDGNSLDWRYISVRRTVIFIEQSIKYAAEAYVFSPNTASTWSNLKAMINNFLTNVWQQGAFAGATAEDAFSVDVGLGNTMTPNDILDGIMRITVKIAVTRPAEFIVITFQQKMQKS